MPRFESGICLKCGRTHDPKSCQIDWALQINQFYSIFSYEDPIKKWISSLKYNRNFTAGRMFQGFVKDWFTSQQIHLAQIDLVIPIPLHFSRLNARGFNQSVFLLNKQKITRMDPSILQKRVRTSAQAGKSKKERQANLKNTFRMAGGVRQKNVLLFDDVCTTGQTLAEAAKVLKRSGANRVDVLVLCRSLKVI